MNASAAAALARCEQRVQEALAWYDRYPQTRPVLQRQHGTHIVTSMMGQHFRGDSVNNTSADRQGYRGRSMFDPDVRRYHFFKIRSSY